MSIANGNTIVGIPVSTFKVQGVSTLNQLEAYGLIRPSILDGLTQAEGRKDAKALAAKNLRNEVQRPFDKARRANAEVYMEYIRMAGEHMTHGGTPAITLFAPPESQTVVHDEGVTIPYNQAIVALDGETQTEARFLLRDHNAESGDWPLAVTFYVGISYRQAGQIVHDYNAYANPIPEAKIGALNTDGPMSVAANGLYDGASIKQNEINRFGPKPSQKQKIANAQVMAAIAGYALPVKAMGANLRGSFKQLNRPVGAQNINGAETSLAPFVNGSLPVSRTAPPVVWQIAGALVREGKRSAAQINWQGGIDAYAATAMSSGPGSGRRGGPRMPHAQRMQAVAAGLMS